MDKAMSNFKDTHHDNQRATLFDFWYEAQTPAVQERLNDWLLVTAACFRMTPPNGGLPYSADTALEMAQSFLHSLFTKDPRQIAGVLASKDVQPIISVKG